MRFISIEETSNGWILKLTVLGTRHEVKKVYTNSDTSEGDAVQRCIKHWLEDRVEDCLDDESY